MASPLEKARNYPESVGTKILTAARRIFGLYCVHAAAIRIVVQKPAVDIFPLHYQCGDKRILYDAIGLNINHELVNNLFNEERMIYGLPLQDRPAISIDHLNDYLCSYPEISKLIIFRYLSKTRLDKNNTLPRSRKR
jgi:hypothetical protein